MSNEFESTHHSLLHSVLKLFTGFAMAALIAWKLIVINAITKAIIVVITKTASHIYSISKILQPLFITYHATGDAITMETDQF